MKLLMISLLEHGLSCFGMLFRPYEHILQTICHLGSYDLIIFRSVVLTHIHLKNIRNPKKKKKNIPPKQTKCKNNFQKKKNIPPKTTKCKNFQKTKNGWDLLFPLPLSSFPLCGCLEEQRVRLGKLPAVAVELCRGPMASKVEMDLGEAAKTVWFFGLGLRTQRRMGRDGGGKSSFTFVSLL